MVSAWVVVIRVVAGAADEQALNTRISASITRETRMYSFFILPPSGWAVSGFALHIYTLEPGEHYIDIF